MPLAFAVKIATPTNNGYSLSDFPIQFEGRRPYRDIFEFCKVWPRCHVPFALCHRNRCLALTHHFALLFPSAPCIIRTPHSQFPPLPTITWAVDQRKPTARAFPKSATLLNSSKSKMSDDTTAIPALDNTVGGQLLMRGRQC